MLRIDSLPFLNAKYFFHMAKRNQGSLPQEPQPAATALLDTDLISVVVRCSAGMKGRGAMRRKTKFVQHLSHNRKIENPVTQNFQKYKFSCGNVEALARLKGNKTLVEGVNGPRSTHVTRQKNTAEAGPRTSANQK